MAAGKTVDNDALLTALQNFEDASKALNGSQGSFFSDFNDILALAEKAKDNVISATNGNGTLPASPFDPVVAKDINSTAQGIQDVNATLKNGFTDLISSINGTPSSPNGSSIRKLPTVKAL